MLSYRVEGGTMVLLRTAVPRPLEGRGLAARLVEAALQHAQAQGLTLQSRCSYVTSYLRAHPQPAGRLATGAAPAATGLVPHSSNESQTRWN